MNHPYSSRTRHAADTGSRPANATRGSGPMAGKAGLLSDSTWHRTRRGDQHLCSEVHRAPREDDAIRCRKSGGFAVGMAGGAILAACGGWGQRLNRPSSAGR